MQGSSTYSRPRESHSVEIRYRCDGSRSPDLEVDRAQSRLRLFCLEFVGDRPAGRLSRIAQLFLLGDRVPLEYDAVSSYGCIVASYVPMLEECKDILQRMTALDGVRYL